MTVHLPLPVLIGDVLLMMSSGEEFFVILEGRGRLAPLVFFTLYEPL